MCQLRVTRIKFPRLSIIHWIKAIAIHTAQEFANLFLALSQHENSSDVTLNAKHRMHTSNKAVAHATSLVRFRNAQVTIITECLPLKKLQ